MNSDEPASAPLAALAGHAGSLRVAVVGGGIAGLVAADECAKVGMRVTVFEACDVLGGTVRTRMLDGMPVDAGADVLTTGAPAVAALLDGLSLTDALRAPDDLRRAVAGIPGTDAAVPLPEDTLLGIPENVWSEDTRRILGTGGTWRAYVDRLRPPLTIGHERSLGRLVRTRMGAKVADRLVAPVTAVFFTAPDDVDVDLAAPGLNAALTRAGSLTGAVGLLRPADGPTAQRGIAGGLSRLVDALCARIADHGGDLRRGSEVTRLARDTEGWRVHTRDDDDADRGVDAGADRGADRGVDAGAAASAAFDGVVVAVPEAAARRLLAGIVPGFAGVGGGSGAGGTGAGGAGAGGAGATGAGVTDAAARATAVETVTMVVDADGLDERTDPPEVLTALGARAAASVLHVNRRWASPAAAGRHVVRVTFAGTDDTTGPGGAAGPAGTAGPAGEGKPATAGLDDGAAVALALGEASALLGVPLPPACVRDAVRSRFTAAPPRSRRGRAAMLAPIRAAVRTVPGLAVTGAWCTGSGLAQVVPDAADAAVRLRRELLFGGEDG